MNMLLILFGSIFLYLFIAFLLYSLCVMQYDNSQLCEVFVDDHHNWIIFLLWPLTLMLLGISILYLGGMDLYYYIKLKYYEKKYHKKRQKLLHLTQLNDSI